MLINNVKKCVRIYIKHTIRSKLNFSSLRFCNPYELHKLVDSKYLHNKNKILRSE